MTAPGIRRSINGLSGLSHNLTEYQGQHGSSTRISQRCRSAFTAATRDIFLRPKTRSQGSDKVVGLQIGCAFDDGGRHQGLSQLQVNNRPTRPRATTRGRATPTCRTRRSCSRTTPTRSGVHFWQG